MSKKRATLTGFMIAALSAGGLMLSAGPASAGGPNGPADDTQLVCVEGQTPTGDNVQQCTVTDPDGVRTILVRNTEETANGSPQFGVGPLECGNSADESVNFFVPAGDRYRVFIRDCEGNRTTFVIRPNGDVNKVNFTPASQL